MDSTEGVEPKEVAKSYRAKAKLIATISSGLFVASSVFASLYIFGISTGWKVFRTGISIGTREHLNSSIATNVTHALGSSAIEIMSASEGVLWFVMFFMTVATLLAFYSYRIWLKSHRIIMGKEGVPVR